MNATTPDPTDMLVRVYLDITMPDKLRGGYMEVRHLNGGLTHAEVSSLLARPVRKKRAARISGALTMLATLAAVAGTGIVFMTPGQRSAAPAMTAIGIAVFAAVGAFISHMVAVKEESRASADTAVVVTPFMNKVHAMVPYVTPSDLLQLADQLHRHRNASAVIEITPAIANAHAEALVALGRLARLKRPEANIEGRDAAAATHLHHVPEVKAAADVYEHAVVVRAAALRAAREHVNLVGQLIEDEKIIAAARQANT